MSNKIQNFKMGYCPQCNSENISIQDSDRADCEVYIETWCCDDCECQWDEVYDLTLKHAKLIENGHIDEEV